VSAAPFPITGTTSGAAGSFARAVARRLSPRTLAVAAAVLVGLVMLAGYALVTPAWFAPWPAIASRLLNTSVAAIFMFVAVVVADEAVERGMPPLPTYALAVAGSAVIGTLAGWHVRTATGLDYAPRGVAPSGLGPAFGLVRRVDLMLMCTLVGGLATFVHVSRRTALGALRRQHEAERARAQAQRRTLESQLQALQARVEPMFLFGTLERIRLLYRTDAQAAGAMLEDLIAYLRAALPHLRESTSTVVQEVTLARAWLDIVGRTVQGWKVDFDVDDAARGARLPALVLLPLVQHAATVVDGAPLALQVSVHVHGQRLRIDVSTSTAAFGAGIAGQPLLEQIGDRLDKLFTNEAILLAGDSQGAGSHARIELPFEPGHEHPSPDLSRGRPLMPRSAL
jgi:hypothetical protein